MDSDELPSQIADVLNDDNGEDGDFRLISSDKAIFKMLVSDNNAGAIIGKGGSTIAQMQEESGARIKVSQNDDFYPGTRDRALLLIGTCENVLFAQELIWQKISQVRNCITEDCVLNFFSFLVF
jgi:hypothetical protein